MHEVLDPAHWSFWMSLGLILAILEVLDGSFFLLSLGLGCIAPTLGASLGLNSTASLVGLCVVGQLLVFFSVRPFFRRLNQGEEKAMNADALVGKKAVVTETIGGLSAPGYVKIGGEEWRAVTFNDEQVVVGNTVEVVSVSGSTVTVKV